MSHNLVHFPLLVHAEMGNIGQVGGVHRREMQCPLHYRLKFSLSAL